MDSAGGVKRVALVVGRQGVDYGRRDFISTFLQQQGYDVSLASDAGSNMRGADLLWIQDNINWFPLLRRQLYSMSPAVRPFVVLWHTEPLLLPSGSGARRPQLSARELAKILLNDPRATDAYTNLRRIREARRNGVPDLLVVSTRSRQLLLAEKGIRSEFIPLGYYEFLGSNLDKARDIDVLFLGALDQPRHRKCLRHLESSGVRVNAGGSWTDKRYWGAQRTDLINRSKIFLNLQRHPGKLSGHRMILGMANGAMVVSEPIIYPEPYVPGKHYVSAALEEMPDVIRHYLGDTAAMRQIADAGRKFVTSELTMEKSVHQIVALIESRIGARRSDTASAQQ